MKLKDYHLSFRDMEKKANGQKVIEVFDASCKRNVLIYEVFAALIVELGLGEFTPEEAISEMERWAGRRLYGKCESSKVPVSPEEAVNNKERSDEPEQDMSTRRVAGKYDMASFMGNSKFSEMAGGA